MMKKALSLVLLFVPLALPGLGWGQGIVVDHTSISQFENIPDAYLQAARNLRVLFMNRSVGANTNSALDCFTASDYGSTPVTCRRDFQLVNGSWQMTNRDNADLAAGLVAPYIRFSPSPTRYDRSNWQFYFFYDSWDKMTTDFIQGLHNGSIPAQTDTNQAVNLNPLNFDVISFQFSYLNVDNGSTIADFFTVRPGQFDDVYDLEREVAEHLTPASPQRVFVYWTSSLARGIGTDASTEFNNRMRDWCRTNNKILFDFADIEAYDMNGNPCYDNRDGVPYTNPSGSASENHADDGRQIPAICQEKTTETDGGHLGTAQGSLSVAKGLWLTIARVAGWPGGGTGSDTTAPTISAISASGITASSATISWTTNEASDTQVDYGLTTGYGQSTSLNTALVTSHSSALSGLTAGTLYHYRVRSRDAAGNLALSTDNTFTTTTTADTTAPTISATGASGITASSATISWTTNEASDTQVDYGLTTGYGQSTSLNTALVTSHSSALSGLTAGTLYHYRVRSRDAASNLALSTDNTFTTTTTADTTAPTISAIGASGITASGATISWTTNEASDTQVDYGLTTSYGQNTSLNTALVTSHSSVLSNLFAGTLYHYRVKSRDAAGNLALSPNQTFTTPDSTAPTISSISVTGITASAATITWTTDEVSDTQVDYGLTTSYGQSTSLNTSLGTTHIATLASLSADTVYHFRVRSRDSAGNLALSIDDTFVTQPADSQGAVTISSLSPSQGARGTTLVINGSGFGNGQGPKSVTLSGEQAPHSNWSNTSITISIPISASSGPIVVTVNGVASNPVPFYVKLRPPGRVRVQNQQ